MMLGQHRLVYSVVNELSIVFRADVPDLATWRPEIARWRMKFHDIYLGLKISLFLSSNLWVTHMKTFAPILGISS